MANKKKKSLTENARIIGLAQIASNSKKNALNTSNQIEKQDTLMFQNQPLPMKSLPLHQSLKIMHSPTYQTTKTV